MGPGMIGPGTGAGPGMAGGPRPMTGQHPIDAGQAYGFPPAHELPGTGPQQQWPDEQPRPDEQWRPGEQWPQDTTGGWQMPREVMADGDQTDESEPGRGTTSAKGSRSRRVLLYTGGAIVLVAGAIAGYKVLTGSNSNNAVSPSSLRLPTTVPSAGSSYFDTALGQWQHIGTRTQDPQPVSVAELYPPRFEIDGSSYLRTVSDTTKNCGHAVFGTTLATALQSGHCTQVVRASYLSGSGKIMGTIGVINLATSSAAQKAGKITGASDLVAPLPSKNGPTRKMGGGSGIVQAEVKGHYLILMWAEFANLKSPSGSAEFKSLEQFAAQLFAGSANISLSSRMLTG